MFVMAISNFVFVLSSSRVNFRGHMLGEPLSLPHWVIKRDQKTQLEDTLVELLSHFDSAYGNDCCQTFPQISKKSWILKELKNLTGQYSTLATFSHPLWNMEWLLVVSTKHDNKDLIMGQEVWLQWLLPREPLFIKYLCGHACLYLTPIS